MNKNLILLRGVQGAGKTTIANMLVCISSDQNQCFAADDYFYQRDGSYQFNPDELHQAHKSCIKNTRNACEGGTSLVVVHNTFSRAGELTPYMKIGEEFGYRVSVLVVENRHGGVDSHNVPQEVREEFAKRIKSNIKLI